MKRILTIILTLLPLTSSLFPTVRAQKPADLNKAVVNVITYDASGNVLHNAYAFLLGTEGEVVAPYQAFKGAASADIINWQGQTAHALRIIGASSEYDLVRLTTDIPTKKLIGLEPAATHASKGQQLQLAYYSTVKKSLPENAEVTAADSYNEHYYYELTTPNEDRFIGCPLLDSEGHVVALVQKNVQKDATTACAIDVNFATALSVNTMSVFNADLNSILIPKQIPTTSEDDAFSYVYMVLHSVKDPAMVIPATDDFIAAYPNNIKIYAERATFNANRGEYALADADLQRGIELGGEGLSDLYHTQSILMYNKMRNEAAEVWPAWTLETALQAAEQAYATQPQPIYLLQQGQVLFTQQQYEKAYEKFNAVNNTDIASSQTFYFAANALERAGGEDAIVVALLDSAVNRLAKPYNEEAAPYLLARAQHLDNGGQHRRAVQDYNEYEKIVGTLNLNAYFYYLRMQAEIGSRMYQQALDDATTAISRSTDNAEKADYLFERACLELQVGLLDESIASCEAVIALDANYAEAYKVCGVAYGEKKQKAKAAEYLKKAASLGAERTDELLQKYK